MKNIFAFLFLISISISCQERKENEYEYSPLFETLKSNSSEKKEIRIVYENKLFECEGKLFTTIKIFEGKQEMSFTARREGNVIYSCAGKELYDHKKLILFDFTHFYSDSLGRQFSEFKSDTALYLMEHVGNRIYGEDTIWVFDYADSLDSYQFSVSRTKGIMKIINTHLLRH